MRSPTPRQRIGFADRAQGDRAIAGIGGGPRDDTDPAPNALVMPDLTDTPLAIAHCKPGNHAKFAGTGTAANAGGAADPSDRPRRLPGERAPTIPL